MNYSCREKPDAAKLRDKGRTTHNRYIALYCVLHAVKSFVEMAKYLLSQPGIKSILSKPGPLKAFSGKQRAQGGRNDNPTCHQFLYTVSLRIQATVTTDPAHVWRLQKETIGSIDETPLPQRQHNRP